METSESGELLLRNGSLMGEITIAVPVHSTQPHLHSKLRRLDLRETISPSKEDEGQRGIICSNYGACSQQNLDRRGGR